MPDTACITQFNIDPFRAYRGSFREAAKLTLTSNNSDVSESIREEARERLVAWLNPVPDAMFRDLIIEGATKGRDTAEQLLADKEDLMFINDHDLLKELFYKKGFDISTSPIPSPGEPMRNELFFITRIASSLYDPFVLRHLPIEELRDAMSDGQLLSKYWLVSNLKLLLESGKIKSESEKPKVAVLGGWIGTLSLMMNTFELPLDITSIDLDERANRIAEKINYDYSFQTRTEDMYDIDYASYDIIINTASEHIPDIAHWRSLIPDGKIIIVQNNNFEEGDGHISCVKSSYDLREKLNLTEIMYEGTRDFPQYARFMLMGKT